MWMTPTPVLISLTPLIPSLPVIPDQLFVAMNIDMHAHPVGLNDVPGRGTRRTYWLYDLAEEGAFPIKIDLVSFFKITFKQMTFKPELN